MIKKFFFLLPFSSHDKRLKRQGVARPSGSEWAETPPLQVLHEVLRAERRQKGDHVDAKTALSRALRLSILLSEERW